MDDGEAVTPPEEAPTAIEDFPKSIPAPAPKKRRFGNRYTTGKHAVVYSKAFKEAAVAQVVAGKSTRQVADDLGIDIGNVGRWVRDAGYGAKAKSLGESPPSEAQGPVERTVETGSEDPQQLRLELARVQGEIALLKELLLGYLK